MKTRKNRYFIEREGVEIPVPGVTTVLGLLSKPGLVKWANRLGLEGVDIDQYRKVEGDVGQIAHKIIEGDIKEQPPNLLGFRQADVDRAMANSIPKWQSWKASNNVEFLLSETPMVSKTYGYGGTFDILARVNGLTTIIDIKTSKAVYDDMEYQLAAYRQLLFENGYDVEEGMVIRLGKDDGYDFSIHSITRSRLDMCFDIFCSLLNVYKNKGKLRVIGGQNAVRI